LAILETSVLEASLDSSLLRTQLIAKGFGPILERIDRQLSRLQEWFVLPEAAAQDVETAFSQLLSLHRKRSRLARELKAAEQALAEEPTEEKLKVLNDIREQLRSAQGEEAAIEGFGEASGRPVAPLA
jgi:DNA primase